MLFSNQLIETKRNRFQQLTQRALVTFHLQITGQVQGVGFRPYIYRIAELHQVNGQVRNDSEGVQMQFNYEGNPDLFIQDILSNVPKQAKVEHYLVKQVPFEQFAGFKIVGSKPGLTKEVRISPDFGLCDQCILDLEDPSDRRYKYAYTTCTQCGPRYSIMSNSPYDRPYTTMGAFQMCPACRTEYGDPESRRFYSQTNSCPDCAILTTLYDHGKKVLTEPEVCVEGTVKALESGQIVAVKGVGGYLLLCDAASHLAISTLRKRKLRPHKPFALMYPSLQQVVEDFQVSSSEHDALTSTVAPIVLLNRKQNTSQLQWEEIAPHLDRFGVMLPYAPLFYLILKKFGKPVIATSGNISGSPIVYQDQSALERLSGFADFILTHNREILVPQDDSVVFYQEEQQVILRRSRGLAPSYYGNLPSDFVRKGIGLGAEMKSAFAISANNQLYISQYLGSLDSYDAQKTFNHVLKHLLGLTAVKPIKIYTDKHLDYHVNEFASGLATRKTSVESIQHHEAHFGAVLLENDLLNSDDQILGVVWDGLGYGSDNRLWGSEFFLLDHHTLSRKSHLRYFPYLLGDKMSKEPRLSALAVCARTEDIPLVIKKKFTPGEFAYFQKILTENQVETSSMGRLFDAVACMLGLIDQASFEGQGAMYLEALARKGTDEGTSYPVLLSEGEIDFRPMITAILTDLTNQVRRADIAFRFHKTLVEVIRKVAEELAVEHLAFSGGVFQNGLLLELIKKSLGPAYHLYFHKELSPNDENIAAGQMACGYMHKKKALDEYQIYHSSHHEISF